MKERSISAAHPFLIGIAFGLLIFATVIASAWFPKLADDWVMMVACTGGLCLAIVISTYWRFLRSWRLWVSLAGVIVVDALCVTIFAADVRNLHSRDMALIGGFELFVTMMFLNWFLDTKKARLEMSRHKHPNTNSTVKD